MPSHTPLIVAASNGKDVCYLSEYIKTNILPYLSHRYSKRHLI